MLACWTARGQLGLAAEPLPLRFRGEAAGQDHLQGHQPPQAAVPGLVDHAHPAASDLAEDGVLAHVLGRRRDGAGSRSRSRPRGEIPGLPQQGERGPPPLRLVLDDRIRAGPGGLQPPQEAVADGVFVHPRAAVRTTIEVGSHPGQLRLRERAGGEPAESFGVRVIRFVDGQGEPPRARGSPDEEICDRGPDLTRLHAKASTSPSASSRSRRRTRDRAA